VGRGWPVATKSRDEARLNVTKYLPGSTDSPRKAARYFQVVPSNFCAWRTLRQARRAGRELDGSWRGRYGGTTGHSTVIPKLESTTASAGEPPCSRRIPLCLARPGGKKELEGAGYAAIRSTDQAKCSAEIVPMRGNALERHTTHSDALTHLASLLHRTTHTRKEAPAKTTSNAGWSSHTATVALATSGGAPRAWRCERVPRPGGLGV